MAKVFTTILIVAAVMPAVAPKAALAQLKSSGPRADSTKVTAMGELRAKDLLFPVHGSSVDRTRDTFRERRGTSRVHNAIDILAPRGTPVVSTDSGRIIKLYRSAMGGLMVYASDPDGRFIYSYAHLDRYRKGLREGATIARGDTLGFVGTSGNAPANTPHLHFSILRSSNIKRWSRGTPLNPFEVFRSGSNPGDVSTN